MESQVPSDPQCDLLQSKTLWGLKRLNLAFYISLILGSVNIISELLLKSIYENWAYKWILIITYSSFLLVNKKINSDLSLVKYVSFFFGESLNLLLIYFAYIEEPACSLIWIQMASFVVIFYQSYLLVSVKSIILFSLKHSGEWAIAGMYFGVIKQNNLGPFISGLLALPVFMFACFYLDLLQNIELCASKQLIKSEASKIEALVEAITDNLFVINSDLECVFMNSYAKSLTNGESFRDFIKDLNYHLNYKIIQHEGATLASDIASAFLDDLGRDCILGVTRKGEEYIEWNGKVKLWEGQKSLILSAKSVTKIIRLEKEQQENQYKSVLLRTVSHELRTPTTAILTMAQLLKESSELSPESSEKVELMLSSCTYLLCLINDLLDYSQIMAGCLKISKVSFDIRHLLSECSKLIEVQLVNSEISLKLSTLSELPTPLISDPYRLKQIILNLLSNARKFTTNGLISLDVVYECPMLKISCQDTGIGIPQDKIPLLFNQFSRIEESFLNPQGVGLGLYISNMLTYELGGNGIKVTSHLGKGSCFSFSIQVEEAVQSSLTEDIPEENISVNIPLFNFNSKKFKEILVVDDTYFNILAFTHMLKSEGYLVSNAMNGKDAIEKILDRQYLCVFMDCEMPVLDGWEATIQLKRMESEGVIKRLPPIIGCTAHGDEVIKYRCLEAGMKDVIAKPCTKEMMIEVIKLWVTNDYCL